MVDHTFSTQEPDAEQLITNPATLRIYFDPMRTRIIRTMAAQPRTVHDIADKLGVPFTRLYYHINMLEKHGLIRVVDVRSLSGVVEEKYYRVTAYRFIIDRALLTMRKDDGDDTAKDETGLIQRVEQALISTQRDLRHSVQRGLVDLTVTPPHTHALVSTCGALPLSPQRALEFQRRLLALCDEFAQDVTSAGTRHYAVALTVYPTTKTDEDRPAPII